MKRSCKTLQSKHIDLLFKALVLVFSVLTADPHLIDSPALMMLTNKLEKLPALVDIALQFSRSLLIRQLIADAYSAEASERVSSF